MNDIKERLDILKDVIVYEHGDLVRNSPYMQSDITSYKIYNNIVEWLYGNTNEFPLYIRSKKGNDVLSENNITK